MGKSTKRLYPAKEKQTGRCQLSTDSQCPVWKFGMIDRNGAFAFDIHAPGFDHKDFLDKMILYSSLTWADIKSQTHDRGKSKHHYLDYSSLSKEARSRISELHLGGQTDAIFSFAFNNTLRVIGIRDREFFNVVWYDRNHQFCPSHLKHT